MRRLMFIALSLGLAGLASAQSTPGNGVRYRWVDRSGLPHYSDSLTDEAVKYGYDVINNSGMVVTHVQRQLTPAEQAIARKQAEEEAARQRAVEAQKNHDIELLNTYPDENALKTEQQQELDNLDQQMNTTRINLHSQEAALTDLLNRAADNERNKQPVPKFLTDQITAQRNIVASERSLLEQQKGHRETVMQQQAQELQHYRALKAAQKVERGY